MCWNPKDKEKAHIGTQKTQYSVSNTEDTGKSQLSPHDGHQNLHLEITQRKIVVGFPEKFPNPLEVSGDVKLPCSVVKLPIRTRWLCFT
ncbi:unnamed protein product [Allacma fusca]|uniref:Uncharacterized protein n=1 Tax=Allacma fusca TaxID=39272 RepID=A0A8J2P430_9HEXA|nr:unnamed protein product [Allacma fusca]